MKAVLEKVDIDFNKAVQAFVYEKQSFEAPWHFHPEFELTLILESSGIRYVGNNISDFKPGDLVLLGSGLPHCWKNTDDHLTKSKSLVIQWNKSVIPQLEVFRNVHALLKLADRGLYIKPAYKEQITQLMFDVVKTEKINQYLKFIELISLISDKAVYELIAGSSYAYDQQDITTNRLDTVQTFVKNNFKSKIKLSEIAYELHMSEQAFSRFFSKTMKKPFFEYLNEYRVNIASRFILESDAQMAEIAYRCGYDSLPFFYKQFKKFKKYTPLEFRKMYRNM